VRERSCPICQGWSFPIVAANNHLCCNSVGDWESCSQLQTIVSKIKNLYSVNNLGKFLRFVVISMAPIKANWLQRWIYSGLNNFEMQGSGSGRSRRTPWIVQNSTVLGTSRKVLATPDSLPFWCLGFQSKWCRFSLLTSRVSLRFVLARFSRQTSLFVLPTSYFRDSIGALGSNPLACHEGYFYYPNHCSSIEAFIKNSYWAHPHQ
jgi:hypothetical protein